MLGLLRLDALCHHRRYRCSLWSMLCFRRATWVAMPSLCISQEVGFSMTSGTLQASRSISSVFWPRMTYGRGDNKQFRSDCPVSFYTLLLSSPKPVECLPKNQACLDDLKALTNKVDESKMLALALQAPTPGAPACTDIVAVDGEDDPSHVDLLPLPPPEPEALLALPPPLEEPQPLVDGSGGQFSSSHPSPFLSSQPHPHHSFRANPPPRQITTTTTSCVLIVPTR